jgi:hypothetical protein
MEEGAGKPELVSTQPFIFKVEGGAMLEKNRKEPEFWIIRVASIVLLILLVIKLLIMEIKSF